MAHDQIVIEHAGRAAPKLAERKHFEFDLQSRSRREPVCHVVQYSLVPPGVEEMVSAQKHIKLQIVVGPVSWTGFQYATFAAAVAAAKE